MKITPHLCLICEDRFRGWKHYLNKVCSGISRIHSKIRSDSKNRLDRISVLEGLSEKTRWIDQKKYHKCLPKTTKQCNAIVNLMQAKIFNDILNLKTKHVANVVDSWCSTPSGIHVELIKLLLHCEKRSFIAHVFLYPVESFRELYVNILVVLY